MRIMRGRRRSRLRLPGGLHYPLAMAAAMLLSTALVVVHSHPASAPGDVPYASADPDGARAIRA